VGGFSRNLQSLVTPLQESTVMEQKQGQKSWHKTKVWLRNKSIAKSPYDISLQASVKCTEPKA
jgi:hypothetical protein